jgi:hypothetical protein
MLTFVILLALMSTLFEGMIAAKIPLWRKIAYKSKLANLFMSILLSYILGVAFGAGGLIAMTAAILSTIMSIPVYTYLNWNYDSPQAKKLPEKSQYAHQSKKWKQVGADTAKMTYGTLKVVTAPIWIPRGVYRKFKPTRSL